jgi:hypothetical protein
LLELLLVQLRLFFFASAFAVQRVTRMPFVFGKP